MIVGHVPILVETESVALLKIVRVAAPIVVSVLPPVEIVCVRLVNTASPVSRTVEVVPGVAMAPVQPTKGVPAVPQIVASVQIPVGMPFVEGLKIVKVVR